MNQWVAQYRETYIKQDPGETPNDRNDRAIRVGTAWYAQRLPQMKIYLLTNDADNRRKALGDQLDAMSVQVKLLLWSACTILLSDLIIKAILDHAQVMPTCSF